MTERLFLRLQEDRVQGPEATGPDKVLRSLPVPKPLRQHVAHSLLYREQFSGNEEVWERVLPDGAVRLVIHLPGPDGARAADPAALIVGASDAHRMVRLRGSMHGLSMTLLPGATMALFHLPAGELLGRSLSFQDLLGDEAVAMHERLVAAPDDTSRVNVLWNLLLHKRRRVQAHGAPAVSSAIRQITSASRRAPLRDVAESVGVGERRLQQLFYEQVGLSPRALGRLARLHHLLRTLRMERKVRWAELAADCGFYDQSHLISEFRALCGMTPTEFLRRTVSGSSKTTS